MRACLQLPMQTPATASRTAAASRTVLTPPSIFYSTIVIGGALLSSGPKLDFRRQALAVCHVESRLRMAQERLERSDVGFCRVESASKCLLCCHKQVCSFSNRPSAAVV